MGSCASSDTPPEEQKASSDIEEYKYVIIGGGNAAGYACNEFVKNGVKKNEVCMISSEGILPYERPALSKGYILGKASLPKFNTCAFIGDSHDEKWYDSYGINIKLNSTATSIDIDNKLISCDGSKSIKYSKLLLATGCHSVKFSDFGTKGSDLNGIYYMRTYADAEILHNAIKTAIENNQTSAVVVGGGYMGMEITAALIQNGFNNITMIFPGDYLMQSSNVFNDKIAQFYEDLFVSKGVTFMKNKKVTGFEGNDANGVKGVLLDNDVIDAEFVFVGIGGRPNTGLFKDINGLEMENRGIKVNEFMETSVKDIYGAGDIVSFENEYFGENIRLEHVKHARASAITAVNAMMESENKIKYEILPIFYSRVFDRNWMFYGNQRVDENVDVFVFGDFKPKAIGVWFNKSGGYIQGMFIDSGDDADKELIEKSIKTKLEVERHLFDTVSGVDELLNLIS